MHGLSFPEFACHVFPRRAPAELPRDSSPGAFQCFLLNWFDQLGLMRGLQQFHLNGKKSHSATSGVSYYVE